VYILSLALNEAVKRSILQIQHQEQQQRQQQIYKI